MNTGITLKPGTRVTSLRGKGNGKAVRKWDIGSSWGPASWLIRWDNGSESVENTKTLQKILCSN